MTTPLEEGRFIVKSQFATAPAQTAFNRHVDKSLIPPSARHALADDVTFYTL